MLKSYIAAALRQFRRGKGSAAVQMVSFATALACCAGWTLFLSVAIAALVSWLAVSVHAVRLATVNPAEVLQYE